MKCSRVSLKDIKRLVPSVCRVRSERKVKGGTEKRRGAQAMVRGMEGTKEGEKEGERERKAAGREVH